MMEHVQWLLLMLLSSGFGANVRLWVWVLLCAPLANVDALPGLSTKVWFVCSSVWLKVWLQSPLICEHNQRRDLVNVIYLNYRINKLTSEEARHPVAYCQKLLQLRQKMDAQLERMSTDLERYELLTIVDTLAKFSNKCWKSVWSFNTTLDYI